VKTPRAIIVAGANGAGKSTLTARYFKRFGPDLGYLVDTDAIARTFSPDAPARASIQAARVALNLLNDLLERKERFVYETTLSDKNRHFDLIAKAKNNGYQVWVFYVGLLDVQLHRTRVAERAQRGGHDIPEEDLLRRFTRSRENIISVIPQVDRTLMFDNSHDALHLVASFEGATLRAEQNQGWWTEIINQVRIKP
jgi:predicted ABC-type ATPase